MLASLVGGFFDESKMGMDRAFRMGLGTFVFRI